MLFGLQFAAHANAQSIIVQPRVSTGVQDYQLHSDDVVTPLPTGGTDIRGGFKVADTIAFVGARNSPVWTALSVKIVRAMCS